MKPPASVKWQHVSNVPPFWPTALQLSSDPSELSRSIVQIMHFSTKHGRQWMLWAHLLWLWQSLKWNVSRYLCCATGQYSFHSILTELPIKLGWASIVTSYNILILILYGAQSMSLRMSIIHHLNATHHLFTSSLYSLYHLLSAVGIKRDQIMKFLQGKNGKIKTLMHTRQSVKQS